MFQRIEREKKTDSFTIRFFPSVLQQCNKNRLLRMQTIFRFVEDFIRMSFKYLLCNFLFPMCRQAVQYHGIRFCHSHACIIDLIDALKDLPALSSLLLFPHARPHIRHQYICIL